jgi:hypothetical protein
MASQIGSLAFDQTGYFSQDFFGRFTQGQPLPIFNMAPERGHAAEFGFHYIGAPLLMYAGVVGNGVDAHVRVTVPGIPAAGPLGFQGAAVTFFGNPTAQNSSPTSPIAFFTNPSDCSGRPLTTIVHADSYEHPGRHNADGTPDFSDPNWKSTSTITPPLSGCNALHFNPTISLQPDTTQPDAPTGLGVDLNVPQNTDPNGLATPDLKNTTVTLPRGMSVSPSAADGLQDCSDAQIDLATNVPSNCPDGSNIGTAVVHTPLLDHVLPGTVYLGTPLCSPCTNADAQGGRMLRLFIQINDPSSGVVLKLPGTVSADPTTGQLTASFKGNPQLPFDDLKLQFKSGPRGTLATPRACGTYTSTADLSPWSAPFTPDATPISSFQVTGCGDPNQFGPSFMAGTSNPQAGAYSPFLLGFSRADADQELSGLSVTLPPGVLAKLAGVPLCSDADANAGNCPASSQVGTVTAGAGPGSHPFFVGGHVYLTGPYKGAPYGLAVQVPAIAGPFNLGTVVVRQALHVDPADAHVTAVSDSFPTILDGIPLQIRTVKVAIDRPAFTLNPTSCEPMQVAGTLTSVGGLGARVSSRFQAANCAGLPFKPSFAASTQANTSKASGASLTVRVAQHAGEANIHKVKLQLPLLLPARLTTLQKACTEAQFNSNPAGCPAASNIGTARAVTPLLETPLIGPAILVSHGGAAFPDVEFVLQAQGIEIILDGKTDIKKGITYSRFETVPDAPISSFETSLPEGPHSALAAFGSLCHPTQTVKRHKRVTRRVHGRVVHVVRTVTQTIPQPLTMPTTITAQSGAVVNQTTKIAVTGCRRPVKPKKGRRAGVGHTKPHRTKH